MNLLFERVEKLLRNAVNDGHILVGYRREEPENITLFRFDSTGGFFRLYDLEEYWFSFSNACEFKIGVDGSIFLKDDHGDAVILNFYQKKSGASIFPELELGGEEEEDELILEPWN